MRVRCSQIDSDKTIMVTFKHDDKFQENSECSFQVYKLEKSTFYAGIQVNHYPLCYSTFSALAKSIGLRNDGRLDDRSYWISHVASISISLAIPLVYPRMISIHDLTTKALFTSVSILRLCKKGDPSGQLKNNLKPYEAPDSFHDLVFLLCVLG
ncbi:hypothetical protein B296_00015532 [Ensete ventricosum]|uniref:Uncharacterized protein n=1 Tax=Ensete ventricosum TaxID=4639 RepID=A0A427A5D9_ENSVE|nr:hypothetical protein B296_00015532 [Ensete ventricosum]